MVLTCIPWTSVAIASSMVKTVGAQIADSPPDKAANIAVNCREALAGSTAPPDALTMLGGQKVKEARTWNQKRRHEIVLLFDENQYGRAPVRPLDLWFEVQVLLNAGFSAYSSAVDDPGVKQGEIWGRDKKRVPAGPRPGSRETECDRNRQGRLRITTLYYGDIDPDFDDGLLWVPGNSTFGATRRHRRRTSGEPYRHGLGA